MRLKNRKKSAAAIKSMKVGTDELKDLIKGAVKEAMGEEDDTGDDGSDTAAALDGITAEDMADIIEQAVDNANEKRKSRKDAGEEVGDLTADEVIQEAAEIIDSMTADEGMDDDEADPEGKDDDEADSDEKDDDEAASEDDAKRRKSAAFRRQVKSGTAPAQRKYSSLFMGGTASAKKQLKQLTELGFDKLPICMAKTQFSFSDDASKLGAPRGFKITVRDLKVNAGAGFLVAKTGDIMTMPGLPKVPSAEKIDVDENGKITGLF